MLHQFVGGNSSAFYLMETCQKVLQCCAVANPSNPVPFFGNLGHKPLVHV